MVLAAPAQAEWLRADSDHFVIFADDSEKDIRRFAEMLEKYHIAMEIATGRQTEKPSPSNRVTIYSMGTARDIQKLAGTKSRVLQGYYIPRAGGSVAFVQDMRSTRGEIDEAFGLLLHEYAHHFLISSQRYAMPRWMSEGAAEFFSSAKFNGDGSMLIGQPNVSRGYELFNADDVSIRELLDPALYAKRHSERYDAFYGRSWLLYHYLTFNNARKGQLQKYWNETAKGTPAIAAGEAAFGDLDQLEKEIDKYLRSRRLMEYTVAANALKAGAISVAKLTAGHATMLPVIAASKNGVDSERAKTLLADARAIAGRYPADAEVQAALSEAEYNAGNDAEAIAAADRAIAADPAVGNAYVQKGLALFRIAGEKGGDAAYAAAMKPFQLLNRRESDHPYPLMYYFRSYAERGISPPESARHALERASQLAPFDLSLAFNVGTMLADEGKVALAINRLRPVASDPHGGGIASQAQRVIDYLAKLREGTKADWSQVPDPVPDLDIEAPEIE